MKEFIRKAVLFLMLLGLVNFSIYVFFTKEIVFKNYIHNDQNLDEYDVFILGDSHGEALKNLPNKFNIFNFSYVGDNYQDMYYKLLYLSSRIDSNDVVLITVNHHTLSTYRDFSNNTIRNLIYVNDIKDVFDDNLNTEFYKSKLFKMLPILIGSYGSFYFEYIKNKLKDSLFNDVTFANVPALEQKKQIENRFYQQFSNYQKSEKGLFFLNKIIELSNKYEFKIKGIKYPVSELYYNKIKDYDMNAELVLTKNNIETIDFQNKYFFTDDMFKDQDHLNEKGASVFLERLKILLD